VATPDPDVLDVLLAHGISERRRRLAAAAKARVEEHHSIEKMIAKIEELYRGLANGR